MLQPRLAPILLALAAFVTSCRSTGGLPPIEGIRTASEARPSLLASATVAPLERISGDVDGLSRALGLPFTGKDLLTMLAAQQRLDATSSGNIDTARPIGLAVVAPAAKDQEPLEALALSARGADGATKLVSALGTTDERQKGAQRITRPDGTVIWVATAGATLFVSGSFEGLAAAGALALEAQKPPSSDLVVTLFPDAFARWQKTDVRTALAAFRKEMIDEQLVAAQRRGAPVPGPAERLMYETALDLMLDPLGDTLAGSFSLDLDAQKGIRVGLQFQPRPGSAFAKQIAAPTPYAVDPALLGAGSDPIAGVWAVGPSPFWMEVYDRVFQAQARAGMRGAAEVSKRYQALRPHLTGAGSGAVRMHGGAMTNDAVVALKGPPSTVALDAVTALASSRGFVDLLSEIYGRATPKVNVRRERDSLRTELAFPLQNRPGDPGTALKAFFGSPTLTALTTVSGGRLLVATEPGASARLGALAAPRAPAPPPELAAALEETRGHDGFLYLDLWSLMKPAIPLAMKPREAQVFSLMTNMPGFSTLKLPMVMSYRGGPALTAELRVPMSALTNAATVARPFLGGARP